MDLVVGLQSCLEQVVTVSDTAVALGSGDVPCWRPHGCLPGPRPPPSRLSPGGLMLALRRWVHEW